MVTADRVLFIAERFTGCIVYFGGSEYILGSITRIFYMKLLMLHVGVFACSTLLAFCNKLECWWHGKKGEKRSADKLMFPNSVWSVEETAFWMDRVGLVLQIFFILCFRNHGIEDQYHRGLAVFVVSTLGLFPMLANVLYLLPQLKPAFFTKKETTKGKVLHHKEESKDCQKGISAMNKQEVGDKKTNGVSNEVEKIGAEKQDNLKEENLSPQKENEAFIEQDTRSNGETKKICNNSTDDIELLSTEDLCKEILNKSDETLCGTLERQDSLKCGKAGFDQDLNEEQSEALTERKAEGMETNKNDEEKYEEKFKKSEEKWEEILRQVREKYEADREKWEEERDSLTEELAIAKLCADVYRNTLHDL